MTTITIDLSDNQLSKLEAMAAHLGVPLEELVRISIEQLLAYPESAFTQAADYVLQKNAELYQRLA